MKNILKYIKLKSANIQIILFIFLSVFSMGCQKDDPIPAYEILPIVELINPTLGYNDISTVRIDIHVSVNGIERSVEEFKLKYYPGKTCSLIKAVGKPVEYEGTSLIKMWAIIFYELEDQPGWIMVNNFDDTGEYKKMTFIRVLLEVRDRNNPSDRFVGIEKLNDPIGDPENLFPEVEWQVNDFSIPGITSMAVAGSCDCDEPK